MAYVEQITHMGGKHTCNLYYNYVVLGTKKMSTYLCHSAFRHCCVHLSSFLKQIIPHFETFFLTHGFVENNSERK
jgi:hypothetical protein